jgi:hypothetical protein
VSLRAVILLCAVSLEAQLIVPAEADTAEEYDAWLEAKPAQSLDDAQQNVAAFARRWPRSKLLAGLHHRVMDLAVSAGQPDLAVASAEQALLVIPTYIPALLLIAEYGPNARRAESVTLARQVFTNYPPPPGLAIEQWRPMRARWGAKLDELQGLAAWGRGDAREAERLLRRSVGADATNARAWLRLARVLKAKPDRAAAQAAYREAAARGDAALKALAESELR